MMHFLALSPDAQAYYDGMEQRRCNARHSDPPVQYLVGTPKGRLNRLEKHLVQKPWQDARQGVQVKLLASCWPRKANSMSSRRVSIASPKSAPCGGDR